jgi:small subunit ribosomal protein S1
VLEVGQEVKVKVINIDREKKRIGLSMRALQSDPWQSKVDKFKVGQLVEGVITRLTKFGAFARLEGDLEGLIHISEISENRIEHPKEAGLHEGDVVTLRVIRIDPDQRRIGLSLRKVDSGAFKDLDLKQISLDGVSLEMAGDTAAPDAALPDTAAPDAAEPDAAAADVAGPDVAGPDVAEPDAAAVDATPIQEEPPTDPEPSTGEAPEK